MFVREGFPKMPSKYPPNSPKSFPYKCSLLWPLFLIVFMAEHNGPDRVQASILRTNKLRRSTSAWQGWHGAGFLLKRCSRSKPTTQQMDFALKRGSFFECLSLGERSVRLIWPVRHAKGTGSAVPWREGEGITGAPNDTGKCVLRIPKKLHVAFRARGIHSEGGRYMLFPNL